MITNSLQEVY